MTNIPQNVDIAVVGYGPTGLAASSLLAGLGHRVAVFERWPSLYGQPRLVNLDAEAARIVQAAGDIESALRESTEFQRYFFKNAAGQTLVDMDWSGVAASGYASHLSMYQPYVEDAIDTRGRERGAIVLQGQQVIGVEQDDDGVTITSEPRDGGEPSTTRATWLIAADGAKSTIRGLLGVQREDLGMRSAFLNLDTIVKRPLAGTDTYRFDAPTVVTAPPRMHVIVPIGTRRLRLELEVLEDDDREALLRPEAAWSFLREWHDLGPDDVEIYRQVIYEFDSQLAHEWRHGRIFLAGDAAHQMAPFLGQGACSGLRDAINLAWRFDLVLRGVCDDGLLDGYQVERLPHVKTQILISAGLGQMATETDPEKAKLRDEGFLSGAAGDVPPDPILADGVLQRDADGAPTALAGELGPQATVSVEGRAGRADDVLGFGFTLLCRGMEPLAGLTDEHRAFLEALGAHAVALSSDPATSMVRDVDGIYTRFFDEHGTVAVLVRPDFSIFGAATSNADVPGLVDALKEQLGARVAA
ncbi:MAG TPA: bifunctional 3-(3-hydroxy-phenyl)propionate/3-hydroxycinnamic acid hydroxylase [Baekduia sp.]|jgi:3-(3-hydroxy-phenyl)propionate hydroxylase